MQKFLFHVHAAAYTALRRVCSRYFRSMLVVHRLYRPVRAVAADREAAHKFPQKPLGAGGCGTPAYPKTAGSAPYPLNRGWHGARRHCTRYRRSPGQSDRRRCDRPYPPKPLPSPPACNAPNVPAPWAASHRRQDRGTRLNRQRQTPFPVRRWLPHGQRSAECKCGTHP